MQRFERRSRKTKKVHANDYNDDDGHSLIARVTLTHWVWLKMILHDESFLQNFGGTSMNSLNTILNTDDSGNNDSSEINILKQSSYHDFNSFIDTTKETTHNFSIFSSKIESLNAKFNEISISVKLLEEKHFNFFKNVGFQRIRTCHYFNWKVITVHIKKVHVVEKVDLSYIWKRNLSMKLKWIVTHQTFGKDYLLKFGVNL